MSAARLPIGTKLGRYEVVKHLARGGMADLSIARASGIQGFERHVVIKHLRPEESEDAQFVEMFLTEARLAGALHHHNIVQVHDIGQENGRHFFAMEYVHGEDVRRLLSKLASRNEKPPIEHVVAIVSAVAAALHHAHEQKGSDRKPLGIVHRDVTPANVIVGYDGNIKVVDFGIAKAAVRKSDTAVGMLKGKVPYMAPEQCTGKPVDRRSDVYGLGVVLYELATVRRLFKGDNEFYVMSAIIGGDIPPPTSARPDLPKALEAIILKALARSPVERFQTADEMRVALETFAEQAGLRFSASALASFMKQLFGDRPEPWLADEQGGDPQQDFDKTSTGLVLVPTETLENRQIPKAATPVRGSLIEQARLNAISANLPPIASAADKPAAAPTKLAIDKFIQADKNPPKKPLPSIKGNNDGGGAVAAAPLNGKHAPLPGVAMAARSTARPTSDQDTSPEIKPLKGSPPLGAKLLDQPVPRRPVAPAALKGVEISDEPTTMDAIVNTDVDIENTEIASPPPAPPPGVVTGVVVEATTPERDNTAIVTPLPRPKSAMLADEPPRRFDRRWLFAGGLGLVGLGVAIAIVMMGSDPPKPEDEPIDLHAKAPPVVDPDPTPTPTPPPPDPAPVAKPDEPKPAAVKPDEPKPAEPKPDEPKPDEPKPDEPKPEEPKPKPVEVQKPKPVATPAPKPQPRPHVVTKPKPKPTPTTKPKDPKWDPNALFLKKKP